MTGLLAVPQGEGFEQIWIDTIGSVGTGSCIVGERIYGVIASDDTLIFAEYVDEDGYESTQHGWSVAGNEGNGMRGFPADACILMD
jgi:hypothetical protein